jgi:hypothetical protein
MRKNELGMTDQEYEDFIDAMADIYHEEIRMYGPGEPEDDIHAYAESVA